MKVRELIEALQQEQPDLEIEIEFYEDDQGNHNSGGCGHVRRHEYDGTAVVIVSCYDEPRIYG